MFFFKLFYETTKRKRWISIALKLLWTDERESEALIENSWKVLLTNPIREKSLITQMVPMICDCFYL